MKKFNLQQKAEQVQCSTHQLPIVQLNISKDIPIGDRLVCNKCQTINQTSLFIETAEKYLIQWFDEEQQQFQKQENQLGKVQSLFERQKNLFENLLESYFQYVRNQLQSILVKQQELLKIKIQQFKDQTQNTLIQDIFHQLSEDTLNATILQQIAQFLSEQAIDGGEIKLKKKLDLSDIARNTIKPFILCQTNQLNKFNLFISSQQSDKIENLKKELDDISSLFYQYQDQYQQIQLVGHNNKINTIAMANNDSLVASGDRDGLIILWRISDKQKIQKYKSQSPIYDLAFSYDNKLLAASQFDNPYEILIFDVTKINLTTPTITLRGHTSTIKRIIFTFDSNYLISGSNDETLKIWDLSNQSVLFQQKLSKSVNGFSISLNKKYLSVCCDDGQAYLFDCQQLKKLKQLIKWQADDKCVFDTKFTPDSEFVLTSSRQINLWSVKELLSQDKMKKPFKVLQSDSYTWSIQLHLNGQLLISHDKKIKVWKLVNDQLICSIDTLDLYDYCNEQNFGVTSDLKYIVTGGKSGKIKFLKFNESTELQKQGIY